MNCKAKVFIHIGHPKTASTSLQLNLFLNHPEINYLGTAFSRGAQQKKLEDILAGKELDPGKAQEISDFWRKLLTLDEISYSSSSILDANTFKENLVPKVIDKHNKVNVISHEGMTNSCIGDIGLKAKRAHSIFPDAKIILVIRNQIDVLRSLYDMHPTSPFTGVSMGNTLTIESWLDFNFDRIERSYLKGMLYSDIAAYYKQLFGERSVGIFVFEQLKVNPDEFSHQLSSFMGIDSSITRKLLSMPPKNTSKDHLVHNFRKKILPGVQFSKILPKETHRQLVNQLTRYAPNKKTRVPDFYKEKIGNFYRETNQKLITELGIDVAQYGYPL